MFSPVFGFEANRMENFHRVFNQEGRGEIGESEVGGGGVSGCGWGARGGGSGSGSVCRQIYQFFFPIQSGKEPTPSHLGIN